MISEQMAHVMDDDAAKKARDAGLFVVMDRCILKEHSRMR